MGKCCDSTAICIRCFCVAFWLNMEKQILKRIERMEDGERDKLRELLKDNKQTYVTVSPLDS